MKLPAAYRLFSTNIHILYFPLLIFTGLIVYSNTFSVPFLFDDLTNIVDNLLVKDLRQFSVPSTFLNSRSLGYLTFAINYWLHGLNVTGYHVVNLVIHVTNSMLVYRLIISISQTPYFSTHHSNNSNKQLITTLARASSFLFLCHPVQTGAVTYIVQRFTLLAALFYLISLVMYLAARRYLSTHGQWRSLRFLGFYSISLLSALLAMKCKEIAFTLPIMIIITELLFFEARQNTRIYLLLPFLVTMAVIPLSLILLPAPSGHIIHQLSDVTQPSKLISRTDYLLTQSRVITSYIRLLLVPVGQNIDYDYPIVHSLFQIPVLASFVFHILNIVLAIILLQISRRDNQLARLVAFGILWFYVTLLVESSIIPLDDVIVEHRLYLPSFGLILSATTCFIFFGKKVMNRHAGVIRISITLAVIILAGVAFARNETWQSGLRLWRDAVLKSPMKPRPHNNLGFYLASKGDLDAAIQEFLKALRINPNHTDAHINLGRALLIKGDLNAAIHEYQEALRISPNDKDAHYNMGVALVSKGNLKAAIHEYQEALRINPNDTDAHSNLGVALARIGDLNAAIQEFQEALRISPNDKNARKNLGVALAQKMGIK